LSVAIYLDCCACNCCSINASDKGFCLISASADADSVGLISNTFVADVDIVIAGGKIVTGAKAQCDVVVAAGVVKERGSTVGCVSFACVVIDLKKTVGRVPITGRVAKERATTSGRVEFAGRIAIERGSTGGRVLEAGCC
jgi:hypothetical protein